VRDVYDLGDELLIVATDRLSTFDVVLPTPIPDRGKVLNQLSAFWFERFAGVVPNHVVTADFERFPAALQPFRDQLAGRSMVVRKTRPLPVECVVRGYLAGSGWKDYRRTGAVCGLDLPEGLVESARLDEPVFTPSTKAESGHDENISQARLEELVGSGLAEQLAVASLEIYRTAREYAEARGVIIADSKFEFGIRAGVLTLIDELLTPDSSRFWDAREYRPGRSPPSFDKQFARDFLERSGWDKQPPAPGLPPEIVEGTRARYFEAFRRLTGREPI
jgi:phosphoribosylaminoimidazole-succinocarboxamide synthase